MMSNGAETAIEALGVNDEDPGAQGRSRQACAEAGALLDAWRSAEGPDRDEVMHRAAGWLRERLKYRQDALEALFQVDADFANHVFCASSPVIATRLHLNRCLGFRSLPDRIGVAGDLDLRGCGHWDGIIPEHCKIINGGIILEVDGARRSFSVEEFRLYEQIRAETRPILEAWRSGDAEAPCRALEAGFPMALMGSWNAGRLERVVVALFSLDPHFGAAALRSAGGWALDQAGSLDFGGFRSLTGLPAGLRVEGDLNLSGCALLEALPDGLAVGGSLDLSGCASLKRLPPGLSVGLGTTLRLEGCEALDGRIPEDARLPGSFFRVPPGDRWNRDHRLEFAGRVLFLLCPFALAYSRVQPWHYTLIVIWALAWQMVQPELLARAPGQRELSLLRLQLGVVAMAFAGQHLARHTGGQGGMDPLSALTLGILFTNLLRTLEWLERLGRRAWKARFGFPF